MTPATPLRRRNSAAACVSIGQPEPAAAGASNGRKKFSAMAIIWGNAMNTRALTTRYSPSFVDGPVQLFAKLDPEDIFRRAAALEARGVATHNPALVEQADHLLEMALAA